MYTLAMSSLSGLRVTVRARYRPEAPSIRCCFFMPRKGPSPFAFVFAQLELTRRRPLRTHQANARKGRVPKAKANNVEPCEAADFKGIKTREYSSNIISRGSELEQLKKLSHLVLETAAVGASTFEELGPQAATVSPSVLLHTLHENATADVGALEGAMVRPRSQPSIGTFTRN